MPTYNFSIAKKPMKKETVHGDYGKVYRNSNVPYGTFSVYGNDSAVYGIKSIVTNKIYIGATTHIQRRLMKHFNELFHNRHRAKELQKDFNKYGFDSFKIIIYYAAPVDNILEKEKELQISIGVDNLYNEKISGYYIKEEYRQQLANSSKDSHKTKEYREKMSKLKSNKIAQYDLHMNVIKIWESSNEICEVLGHTKSVILSCCNGSKPHAYGFNWRYVDDNGNIVSNGYLKARKK